jgi:hypothetical protein
MLLLPQTLIIKQLFVVIISRYYSLILFVVINRRNFFERLARRDATCPVSGAGAQEGRQYDCDHIGKLPTCPTKIFASHALWRAMSNWVELGRTETSYVRVP